MDKYHVNDKGEAGRCGAYSGGCPFGGDSDHYTSPEEARAGFEEKMNHLTFTQISLPRNQEIRKAMVRDELTDEATLMVLADDPSSSVRRALAGRLDISTEIADKLASDRDALVRRDVGMNTNLSMDARLALLSDPDEDVRYYSMKIYPIPTEMLIKAASDPSVQVRQTAAWDSGTPDDILGELASDSNPHVAKAALTIIERKNSEDW